MSIEASQGRPENKDGGLQKMMRETKKPLKKNQFWFTHFTPLNFFTILSDGACRNKLPTVALYFYIMNPAMSVVAASVHSTCCKLPNLLHQRASLPCCAFQINLVQLPVRSHRSSHENLHHSCSIVVKYVGLYAYALCA